MPARPGNGLIQIKIGVRSGVSKWPRAARLDSMHMHRRSRRRVSSWMIGVMLLAQWLVAAYACPVVAQAAASAEESASQVAMANCHGMSPAAMDPANPSLCKAHCDDASKAPAGGSADHVPASALVWFVIASADRCDVAVRPAIERAAPRAGAPPGWPPIYLTQQVLRN